MSANIDLIEQLAKSTGEVFETMVFKKLCQGRPIEGDGTGAVRNLVVTVCFYSRMQDRNVYGERGKPLLEHGIGTACMARLLAEWLGLDEEEAFMYGLLHDIGKRFGCEADPVDLLPDPVCKELGIDQAWLDQTDKHAPGLVDVAKKILG